MEALPLSGQLLAEVQRLQRVVCASARSPGFLSQEEVAEGGVRIGIEDLEGVGAASVTLTTDVDREVIYAAICADVAAGVLEEGEVLAKGRVFVGPKNRVIYDPAAVNEAIPLEARRVTYGSIAEAYAFGLPLAVKLDLKDAYKSVPVAGVDRPYLGMEVDGCVLRYAALPFGLATAPRLFVECLGRTLRCVSGRMVSYVDDILILGGDCGEVVASLGVVVTALVQQGWRVSAAKTFARPTVGPIFLGFRLGLQSRTISLAPAKLPAVVAKAGMVRSGARSWRRQLHELLGFVAWAAPALKGSGFVVPALFRALRTGQWDSDAEQCMCVLERMLVVAVQPTAVDPPALQVAVVTDASDCGWAVVVVDTGGAVQLVERGELSAEAREWSSTAREAVAAVKAVGLVLRRVGVRPGMLAVHLSTDSAALAAVVNRARTRSVEVAVALQQLVEWVGQGLVITASWCRRSEGLQPLADAASGGHMWWHPAPALRGWLARFRADVHVGAGSGRFSVAPCYTSVVDDEVRAAVMDTVHSRGAVAWSGWIGVGCRFDCRGLAVVCHPRWGDERRDILALRGARRVLVVTRAGSMDRRAFRGLSGTVAIHLPPPRARWWTGIERGGAGGREEAALRRIADLVVVDYVPGAQADAEQRFRLAVAQCLHPGPTLAEMVAAARAERRSDAVKVRVLAGVARKGGRRAVAGEGASANRLRDLVRVARARRAAGGGGKGKAGRVRRISAAGASASGSGVRVARDQEGCDLPPTVEQVLSAVARGAPRVGTDLNAAAERHVAAVRDAVRRPAAPSTARATRAAEALLVKARELSAEAEPASAAVMDKVAVAFVHGRTTGSMAVAPVTAMEDVCALAAAMRRHGYPVAPYMGPITQDYLARRGAMLRRQHSNALPIPMSWLLAVEPQAGTLDHEIWASRMLQAAFCLRPGIAGQVRKGNLTRWGPGWTLAWVQQDKTRQQDVLAAPGTPMNEWRVTATAQPQAVEAIQTYWDAAVTDADWVFPRSKPAAVLGWLRRTWVSDPEQVPRLTSHGFRLGVDMELHELGVPSDYVNVLGWWARKDVPGKSMRAYYNSVSLGKLMCCTSFLGKMTWTAPAAGVHVGPGVRPRRWDKEWGRFCRRLPAEPPELRGPALATLQLQDDADDDD